MRKQSSVLLRPLSSLLLIFSLKVTRVLTGSEAALEPEQFLRMMAEISERVEQRRADHGLVGHYNSAHCSTIYEEVCTTTYSQECHNQVSFSPHSLTAIWSQVIVGGALCWFL